MIKINLEDLIKDQEYADNNLFDAENKSGLYDKSKEFFENEEEYEQSRIEIIQESKERLRPRSLTEIHLPQIILVRLDMNSKENSSEYIKPFEKDKTYVCLGEIAQMPGHVVVMDYQNGEIYSGYHSTRFEIIPVNEH